MKFQRKTWLALALALSLSVGNIYATEDPDVSEEPSVEEEEEKPQGFAAFTDVSDHWAVDVIEFMVGHGLFTGKSDTLFAPNDTMTRAEFVTVVVRYLYPTADYNTTGSYWYSGFYATAVADNLLPSTFREQYMNQQITRQEMAYIMISALKNLGDTPSQLVTTKSIADYSSISAAYQDNVLAAYSMGLISGRDDAGTFAPHDNASRAECAVVLRNMIDTSARLEVDFQKDPNALTDINRLDLTYTKNRDALSYDIADPNRPIAKVGDTVTIGGSEVVLTAHPSNASVNGLNIPYVEGTALDLGINTQSTYGVVAHGWAGGGIHHGGDTYYVNPHTGVGLWSSQWTAIQTKNPASKIPGTTDGQLSVDPYSLWTWVEETSKWTASYLVG